MTPASPELTKLARTAFALPEHWLVFTLKDATEIPVVPRQPFTSISSVSAISWNPQSQSGPPPTTSYPPPRGCSALAMQMAFGHERDNAILELLMAGWWCLSFSDKRTYTYLLPRPDVKMKEGRVHCEDGPAVIWPEKDAAHLYYIEGVEVPKEAIDEPAKLPDLAIGHENAEVRRVLTNLYGHERLMRERGKIVQQDEYGKLYSIQDFVRDLRLQNLKMVEVKNSTPEPDGSFRRYMLRVPPAMKTAKEAVAWTFSMTEKEYQPQVQT